MKHKVQKVVVSEEDNELGRIFLERLIERMLLEKLNIHPKLQAHYLHNRYRKDAKNDRE